MISLEEQFAALPRKPLREGQKEAVWLRIESQIQERKIIAAKPTVNFFPLFRFQKVSLALLVILAAVGVVGGATKASEESLPGERLYPVKKATEQVEKVLATSAEAEVKVGIKHAKRRLFEVKTLVQENKDKKAVAKTLEALVTTTEAVIAASQDKPELVDQVVKLASEEERVLAAVENQVEGEIKAAVQKVITLSRESITKLKGEKEEVQGTATDESTTTPEVIAPSRKSKPKDGPIESNIQIHGVIKLDSGKASTPQEPEILPEPTVGF